MAPNLPRWKAAQIDRLLSTGIDVDLHTLATEFGTTYKTICARRRALDSPKSSAKLPGPAAVITADMREFIAALLEREPDLYQDEIAAYLIDTYDVEVSVNQVSKALKRLQNTKKVLTVSAAERNDELVAAWRRKMVFWDAKRICFIDESACNERITDRRRGWSPRGAPARVRRSLKTITRWSVLPAYSLRGYIEPIIFKGSITAEIFENWLERDILPECIEQGLDILIMDNASIHRNPRVAILCEQFGVQLEYLPSYCPFFNPIEESFAYLKSWVRRNWRWNDYTWEDFEGFLKLALREVGVGVEAERRARGYFRHSGYQGVPGDVYSGEEL